MPASIYIPILSLIIGLCSGMLGGYMGVKISVVKLETWREILDGNINRLTIGA